MHLTWILAGASVAVATWPSHDAFETLVTFGDSYTDNGRLNYYLNNGGKAPPPGQYHPVINTTASGGLSWAQFAAQDAGANLMDYAVSGAVCSNKIVSRYVSWVNPPFPFPDVLDDQIPSFKADVAFKSLYPHRTDRNTVYALWIGTNDLGNDAFLSDSQTPGKTISDFVDCIWSVFDHIYQTGGRRFVLLNTAPLERAPQYVPSATETGYNSTAVAQKIREYTTSVNTMYKYGVPFQVALERRWPRATVDIFDVHSLFLDIFSEPAKYLDAPYNTTGYYRHCDWSKPNPCVDQLGSLDSFMWFDALHPSNITSSVVAKNFLEVVAGKSKYGTRYY
ncbi:carbohydrate esterase family 16 protein [Chaetomium sp. MPI-CAGE-AT-0009]|nr:carbohydrate esterase family 16 protein [Chaetomium sp. MPI-CAGE-AT-0009]